MKKSVLIICIALVTVSLTALGYVNLNNISPKQNNPQSCSSFSFDNNLAYILYKRSNVDLFYNVDSRFLATITKENLHKAKTIIDIFPKKATQSINGFHNVTIFILNEDNTVNKQENGITEMLTSAQIQLLQNVDYSTNIVVRAEYLIKNTYSDEFEDDHIIYYMSILPETEAEFTSGHDALIHYLKENTKELSTIIEEKHLQPGKVSFIVTKNGDIADVKLTSTSGYDIVDKTLIRIIEDMPKKWKPATNSKGEKVDQGLVFFFGLQGC